MKIHHQYSIFKPPTTSSSSSPSPLFKSQKTHDDSPLPLPLRVGDILSFDDKEHDVLNELLMTGEEARCRGWRRSSSCYPPNRIAARWLSGLRSGATMKGLDEQDSRNSASEITVSEQCNREATVNLGVGCCLLHLIAATKNELDKMLEMRMQMEKLLENVREELRKKDGLSKLSNVCAYSTTHIVDGPDFEIQHSPQIFTSSYGLPGSSAITVCDHSLRWETPMQEECSEGMDKLEAELEVELERLQLHLDAVDNSVKCPQKKGRWNGSSGEVEDQAAGSEEHCGVPPHELERRLHELLESRQQEHIRELEAKLKCLEHKLREKEMEVSWWKDTARLISRHLPESSKSSPYHPAKLLSP
ncbi:PROTEIN POLAR LOCALIZATION DURING ASYMMETRIC DIVISION AND REDISTRIBUTION [Salix koriyanagi]|uniref:PROTEIN POLAR LOCALIZATION DURING ASYMMETRIC DIVISION AND REDISTRIBUTION n=1 Tax=Salix koriyanagi TaxID=2511006 RepID=A0A9Q1A555_9ROSI|nr:PROTEIN POLAR LOCALIZATION DURING ASYMMETRIC DIVISION AND REDISTRIBUTION [Salix koriyanagi]